MKTVAIFFTTFAAHNIGLPQSVESEIEQIRTWFKATEAGLKNCAVVTLEETYEDGVNLSITGFYDKTQQKFVKIKIEGMGDWTEENTEYFLHDERLYFTFEKGSSTTEFYSSDEGSADEGPTPKSVEHFEYRHYYSGDACIRYLVKAKTFDAGESNISLTAVESMEEDCSFEDYSIMMTDIGDLLTRLRSAWIEMNK